MASNNLKSYNSDIDIWEKINLWLVSHTYITSVLHTLPFVIISVFGAFLRDHLFFYIVLGLFCCVLTFLFNLLTDSKKNKDTIDYAQSGSELKNTVNIYRETLTRHIDADERVYSNHREFFSNLQKKDLSAELSAKIVSEKNIVAILDQTENYVNQIITTVDILTGKIINPRAKIHMAIKSLKRHPHRWAIFNSSSPATILVDNNQIDYDQILNDILSNATNQNYCIFADSKTAPAQQLQYYNYKYTTDGHVLLVTLYRPKIYDNHPPLDLLIVTDIDDFNTFLTQLGEDEQIFEWKKLYTLLKSFRYKFCREVLLYAQSYTQKK